MSDPATIALRARCLIGDLVRMSIEDIAEHIARIEAERDDAWAQAEGVEEALAEAQQELRELKGISA